MPARSPAAAEPRRARRPRPPRRQPPRPRPRMSLCRRLRSSPPCRRACGPCSASRSPATSTRWWRAG
ncbi:MAG: hypothetical protein MZV64_73240 [Ignavibacteriales bacterium]|nr:hypothetical protein [Ignavibacteriales bacterium]